MVVANADKLVTVDAHQICPCPLSFGRFRVSGLIWCFGSRPECGSVGGLLVLGVFVLDMDVDGFLFCYGGKFVTNPYFFVVRFVYFG